MKKVLLTAACSALLASNAYAGGFQLSEYSNTLMGRAFAGYGVVGDDYSAIAFNPAGMTLRDSGVQAGVSIVALNSKVTGYTAKGAATIDGKNGKLNDHPLVPYFFAQYKLNDKTRIGAAAHTPYAFQTNYSKYWFGRSHAIKSDIKAIDYNISASYDVTSKFSIGASIIAETMEAELTNVVDQAALAGRDFKSKVEGRSYETIWNAGLLYRLSEDTRLGVSYHSRAVHKIRGSHHLSTLPVGFFGDAGAKLILPEYYIVSAYHKIGDFGLSASAKRTRWSKFKTLDIYSTARQPARTSVGAVNENWRDTWMFALGTDYYMNDSWTLRTGVAYDQAGVTGKKYRTARVPDSDRFILSVGASYKVSEKVQIDFNYGHIFMKKAKSENTLKDGSTLFAKYNSSINMAGIAFQYNF